MPRHRAGELPTITFLWNVAGKCWDVVGSVPQESLRNRITTVKVHSTISLDQGSMEQVLLAVRATMEAMLF